MKPGKPRSLVTAGVAKKILERDKKVVNKQRNKQFIDHSLAFTFIEKMFMRFMKAFLKQVVGNLYKI
jgi:hypothetical protein